MIKDTLVSNTGGMSLVQVMIFAGLVSGMSVSVVQTIQHMNKGITYSTLRQELTDAVAIVTVIISSSVCKDVLKGTTTNWVGALTSTPITTPIASALSMDRIILPGTSASPVPIFAVNQMLNNNTSAWLKTTNVEYEVLNSYSTVLAGSPTYLANSYAGNLIVTVVNNAVASGQSIGPRTLQRKIPLSISMKRDVSSALNNPWVITACAWQVWN